MRPCKLVPLETCAPDNRDELKEEGNREVIFVIRGEIQTSIMVWESKAVRGPRILTVFILSVECHFSLSTEKHPDQERPIQSLSTK